MVEELELTDQDVTTIADMIDSEIRYHIPDRDPSKTHVNSLCQDSAVSGGGTSETRHDASPGSLALETLPSGRKYWSDSPKALGGSSPSRHGASHLSYEVDANGEVDVNAEEGSLNANGAISVELVPDDQICVGEYIAEKECDGAADSPFSERSITSGYLDAISEKSSQEETPGSFKDSETEDMNKIAVKLENLLVRQRQELDELKRKHKLDISDLLEELSPEICQKVLNICNLQMADDGNIG